MSEVKDQILEESAQKSETIEEQKDIAENWTPTKMAQARQKYIKERKSEIEILKVDVEFLDLQVKHYNLTKQVGQINAEIKEAKRLAESEDFKAKIAI